ncbi:MAG: Crp/Fnr family transcriptional regulator [Defluviitaleaceae bacterium]|nr:Crp/Fnr family transcriptional regulator [Defluviitaleaceae bacterium]
MELDYKSTLQKSTLFSDINTCEYENLLNCLSPGIKHFSKNEMLLITGDIVTHMGVVLSGTAHAYLEHIDGTHILISNLTQTSIYGEILVSTRTHKSPVTVYAMSDMTVALIEYRQLFSICTKACVAHRMFIQNMLRNIGDKYFRMFDRINILREKNLRAKILAYLHMLRSKGQTTVVTIPFTKTMLASYLMANRSALSKELKKMADDGLITISGKQVTILK